MMPAILSGGQGISYAALFIGGWMILQGILHDVFVLPFEYS